MKILRKSVFKLMLMSIFITLLLIRPCGLQGAEKSNIVLKAMEDELSRSMKVLGEKGSPPPYFISYQINDIHKVYVSTSFGALSDNNDDRSRLLFVEVRVGDHKLDNTHPIRGDRYGAIFDRLMGPQEISLDNDADAIKSEIWLQTDKKYKAATENLIRIKTSQSVSVKEEDQSDDFSKETPNKFIGEVTDVSLDTAAWEIKLKEYSALFNKYPEIYNSRVSLNAEAENKYFVNSEGTVLLHGRTSWRLSFYASSKADDGMELMKFQAFDASIPENLPDEKTIKAEIEKVVADLLALRNAPTMEPYTGPAILSGKAASVFFHEIFGHRIEGHRQKSEDEGQTFTKKINEEILPDFLSVYDDPTVKTYEKEDLNGYYIYDDEGVKAQRVELVKDGILKGFLMSRSPVKGFPNSNGHGRCQAGLRPVSRQGVLIIESSQSLTSEKLREKLIAECKSQGKDYGLFFDSVTGGFTNTQRYRPEAFNVTPIIVYKIYVDGRPDELVRGVNLIGTPLTSFSKIIAADNKPEIFNGTCGAESGGVPVSAISPALLTSQIEVQKKYKDTDKPPVLPPPARREK